MKDSHDPIRTAGQDEAIRAGASNLASGAFEAIADAHFRRQRGQATTAEIAFLDTTPEWQLEAALNCHRDVVIPDRQRIAADLRRHGRRAHAFYREVRPHDYDAVTATSTVPQVRHRPQARRRGAGRPRATASRSSARSGDSGDDGGEPPAPLRLASTRAVLTFGCLSAEARGAEVEETER
jgi:hypothetical protein